MRKVFFFLLFIDLISMLRQLESDVIANSRGNSVAIPNVESMDEFSVRQYSISLQSQKHSTTQINDNKMCCCVFTQRHKRTNEMITAGVLLHILYLLEIEMSIALVACRCLCHA